MRLPEIVVQQQQAFQYLAMPIKSTSTKTSSALTGPISSVVPSSTSLSKRPIEHVQSDGDLQIGICNDLSEASWTLEKTDSFPSLLKTPSAIYKDFGNGLCFCNTNIPSNMCDCPYDFIHQNSVLEKDIVSEEILMEFLQDLEVPDSRTSELDIEMVDLGDLSDFLDELAKE